MSALWEQFNLDIDQFNLLQTLATAFGLWYPEQGGYVIPTLMQPSSALAAVGTVPILKAISEDERREVQFDNLPGTEYQIIMKFVFPRDMPQGESSLFLVLYLSRGGAGSCSWYSYTFAGFV